MWLFVTYCSGSEYFLNQEMVVQDMVDGNIFVIRFLSRQFIYIYNSDLRSMTCIHDNYSLFPSVYCMAIPSLLNVFTGSTFQLEH